MVFSYLGKEISLSGRHIRSMKLGYSEGGLVAQVSKAGHQCTLMGIEAANVISRGLAFLNRGPVTPRETAEALRMAGHGLRSAIDILSATGIQEGQYVPVLQIGHTWRLALEISVTTLVDEPEISQEVSDFKRTLNEEREIAEIVDDLIP